MIRIILSCLFLCILFSCRPKPFRVEKLTPKEPPRIEAADPARTESFALRLDDALADRYRAKKSPSFAIINGYYRLPEAKPYGAATIVRSYSYQTYVEGISVSSPSRDAVITPIAGDDAISLEQAVNALLTLGVVIKEISVTDALAIAKAEQDALSSDTAWVGSTTLPPNVDYLISIYPASSKRGAVMIGRVIKRDGTLMAFRVVYRGDSDKSVGNLIVSLFEDTLSRL